MWQPHQPFGDTETAWARRFVAALAPHDSGVYLNFLDRDDQHRAAEAFTPTAYARLTELQQHWDPDRVLRTPVPTPITKESA
ncbi:MAG: BBE domain-containing protein [Acidimicrobiales bacterium]